MGYVIKEVETNIQNNEQIVIFSLENYLEKVAMTYSSIQKVCPSIGITEIEILNGCKLNSVYYSKGDIRPSGTIVTGNYSRKGWMLEMTGSLEECRIRNQHLVKGFEEIVSIRIETSKFNNKCFGSVATCQRRRYFKTNLNVFFNEFLVLFGCSEVPKGEREISFPSPAYISPELEEDNALVYFNGGKVKCWNLRLGISSAIEKTIPNVEQYRKNGETHNNSIEDGDFSDSNQD